MEFLKQLDGSSPKKKNAVVNRTRSFGRKLSRSMSTVALKLPETAQTIRRKSKAALKVKLRERKREFQIVVVTPEGAQRQTTVSSECTVNDVVNSFLKEFDAVLVESHCFGSTCSNWSGTPVHLRLEGSGAPVRVKASAAGLEGEILLIEKLPFSWNKKDLRSFIAWERLYVSTLLSALELYGKPLLRAECISKDEFRLLFHYLESVAEASLAMLVRMESYINSDLLNSFIENSEAESQFNGEDDGTNKSILRELVQEGFLTQRDLDISQGKESIYDSSVDEIDNITTVPKYSENSTFNASLEQSVNNGNCCTDHRKSSEFAENVWANVQWDFLGNEDCQYDLVPAVRKSKSDGTIFNAETDDYYTRLGTDKSGSSTPYESIEDLYDCIKNMSQESDDVQLRKEVVIRDNCTERSTSSDFDVSINCGVSIRSDKTESAVSYSDFNYKSSSDSSSKSSGLIQRHESSNKFCELSEKDYESIILLKQLFGGELMDAYGEFVSSYRHARALLRSKTQDEHFQALVDIRKGVACYDIADYLELPIERLAAYERLVGNGTCGRKQATRLSDLERVQDLFPHDHLALHDNAEKKILKWPPSPEKIESRTRTFLMEAPVSLCSIDGGATLDRHLFLFSDLLIVGKSRGGGRFKLKERINLGEVWTAAAQHDTGFLLGWATASGPVTYLAVYPTQAARDTWLRKIKNAVTSQLESEPKSTNIQVVYKDTISSVEFCKTLAATPDMTVSNVVRAILAALRNNNDTDPDPDYGHSAPDDFVLWVRMTRHTAAIRLHGIERVHAIQMCRIRQTLSNEEGFDLEHVNSKHNPCGLVFELRKKNNTLTKSISRSGERLWGLPLESVCNGPRPPPALMMVLTRLRSIAPRTHGVFRRCPSVRALRLLRDELDRLGPKATRCSGIESASALLLAALLKDYFRSLPDPLLTTRLYPHWIRLIDADMSESSRVESARALAARLPTAHYVMLAHAICILAAVARRVDVTEMCAANLGVCVGPSLLWPVRTSPSSMGPPSGPAAVVRLLIANAEAIFGPRCLSLLGTDTPDSGAEESDSLHSLGASLDSTERIPRKEKLSLSRDSGLTLSEDDSVSAGNDSPARPPMADRYMRSKIEDMYGLSPPIYPAGPVKPPRAKTSEIYGNPTRSNNHTVITKFCRAKSSDDLLDSEKNRNGVPRSNEGEANLYGRARLRRTDRIYDTNPTVNYSRVYSDRENRNSGLYEYANNNGNVNSLFLDSIYDNNTNLMSKNDPDTKGINAFVRKDWTRKASRTKSLETGEELYSSTELLNGPPRYEIYGKGVRSSSDSCLKRLTDPSHLCTNKCSQTVGLKGHFNDRSDGGKDTYAVPIKKHEHKSLAHSKSLANIVVQSDSSSSDTLYQRQSTSLRSSDSPASENSTDNSFASPYRETSYTSPIYESRKQNGYPSDIYTAKLTNVEPENLYGEPRKVRNGLPPPVPPRNIIYQSTIKRIPPFQRENSMTIEREGSIYGNKRFEMTEDKYPPTYREPPTTKASPQSKNSSRRGIALNNDDTDTESESYV